MLAGLEVLETLEQAGRTTLRPLAVAFFTDEEGSRFPPDMLGSLTYVGGLALEEALDAIGERRRSAGRRTRTHRLRRPAPVPRARAARVRRAAHRARARCSRPKASRSAPSSASRASPGRRSRSRGQSNHAGTTPMRLRHDAGYVAAPSRHHRARAGRRRRRRPSRHGRCADAVPEPRERRGGAATLTVDLRNTDESILRAAEQQLATELDALAPRRGCDDHDEVAGPLRTGRVRRAHRRSRRAHRQAAGAHGAAHAVGRGSRRADAGAGLPGRDDLRAVGRRHQPQPGRAHRSRPTSPPARTCCST